MGENMIGLFIGLFVGAVLGFLACGFVITNSESEKYDKELKEEDE